MAKITYTDKDAQASSGTPEREWRADDANSVKNVVNENADLTPIAIAKLIVSDVDELEVNGCIVGLSLISVSRPEAGDLRIRFEDIPAGTRNVTFAVNSNGVYSTEFSFTTSDLIIQLYDTEGLRINEFDGMHISLEIYSA